jgi:hypothetical protein
VFCTDFFQQAMNTAGGSEAGVPQPYTGLPGTGPLIFAALGEDGVVGWEAMASCGDMAL